VDDDLSIRKAVGRLLRAHGYSCAVYESGEAALADPEFLRMDCLVVDIQLGGITGLELCKKVRALCPSIPYIFITAFSESSLTDLPGRVGDSILLIKPFGEGALLESIERTLAERRNQ
jgi:FixJ family two-component response regulator